MKFSLVPAVIGAAVCTMAITSEAHMTFEQYLKAYGKAYKCAKKRAAAEKAFERRAAIIESHNRLYKEGKTLYEMGYNIWSDVPESVIDSYMGYEHRDLKKAYSPKGTRSLHAIDGVIRKEHIVAPHDEEIGMPCHHHQSSRGFDTHDIKRLHKEAEELRAMRKFKQLPRHVDWREPMHWPRGKSEDAGPRKSAVTPVKEQGHCGSCYAFGTTETVESHLIINTGFVVDLSTQMVADCSRRHEGHKGKGCGGGNAIDTWELLRDKGIPTEWQYPYDSGHGTEYDCRYRPKNPNATQFFNATPPVVKATGEAHTAPNDLYAVMHALATRGPLTISIDADEWHLYKEGIFDASFNKSKTTINVDHTVQLVGYGEDEEGNLFWTVRNSWGVDFGESGFIRLRRSSPHAVPCKCPTYIPNCTVGDNGIYRTASEAAKEDTLICGADGILGDVSYPTGVYHIESTVEPHRR